MHDTDPDTLAIAVQTGFTLIVSVSSYSPIQYNGTSINNYPDEGIVFLGLNVKINWELVKIVAPFAEISQKMKLPAVKVSLVL